MPRRQWFPRPVPAIPAQTWRGSAGFTKQPRPYVIPMTEYDQLVQRPIVSGYASVVLSGAGGGSAQAGPQGLGTRWRVSMATISTTNGPNDPATALVYAGTKAIATFVAGQSYAGGGDSAGFNDLEIHPGQYIVAVWSGSSPGGAVATLTVYGTEFSLERG